MDFKKIIAFLALLTIPLFVLSVNAVMDQKPEGYTADDAVNLNPDPTGPIIPKVNSNPEPVFRANKGTSKDKLFDINKKIKKDKIAEKKGKLQKVELKTFGEYHQTYDTKVKDFTQVSPDHLVWVVESYYPEGIDHPKVGVIKNAQVVGAYDAETGDLIRELYRSLQ
ncbi:MAG: hypothetical protein KME12_05845 [Trichocoleus desertorum ATA4-8-CV12]|jgi:hypothetical protein|nr:hypothetical protein [Trichocoleus desertorum ATA4-8-CV12]